MLEHLIYQQHPASLLVKLTGKVGYAASLKVKVVHVYIQAPLVFNAEILFRILQKESGLAYSARTFYTYHPCAPVHLVHKGAPYRSIGLLDQVSVCTVEFFHGYVFFMAKVIIISQIAKRRLQFLILFNVFLFLIHHLTPPEIHFAPEGIISPEGKNLQIKTYRRHLLTLFVTVC